jgi:hypothetical protein
MTKIIIIAMLSVCFFGCKTKPLPDTGRDFHYVKGNHESKIHPDFNYVRGKYRKNK